MDLGIEGLGEATEIGVGGSAIVYRARQARLDRTVAVKVLTIDDPAFVRRFEREARTLGKLSQKPGIVTVYDTGVTGSGRPYLVLELCPSSLQDRLDRLGPMAPRDACELLAPVARAVQTAHAQGVVHRDLKPGNILLTDDGEPLVTDFGIATVGGATMGQTASVGFTPGYVAPETVQGRRPEAPADVYALGATLFQTVAGYLPFDDGEGNTNLLALAKRVSNEPLPNLRLEGVPEPVCRIIEAAMAKDPDRRPTAERLHRYLQTASRGGFPDFDESDGAAGTVVAGSGRADSRPAPPTAGGHTPQPSLPRPVTPPPSTPNPITPPSSPRPITPASSPRPISPPATPNPVTPPATPNPVVAQGFGRSGPATPTPGWTPQPMVGGAAPRLVTPPLRSGPGIVNQPASTHSGCFLRFSLGVARGVIAAILTFVIGLTMFLVGLQATSGELEFDSDFGIIEQAGAVGGTGLFLFIFGPFVAFPVGALIFPWPRIKR